MPRFWLGAAYGVAVGLVLGALLDIGDLLVGYIRPTTGRFHP